MHAVRSRVLAVTDVTGGERKSRRSIHVTITLTPQVSYPYIDAPARLGRFVSDTSRMTFCGISFRECTTTREPSCLPLHFFFPLFFAIESTRNSFSYTCALSEQNCCDFFKFSLVASIKRRRVSFQICDKNVIDGEQCRLHRNSTFE